MIDTRPAPSRQAATAIPARDVRRLIATDYSRRQLAGAICESFVQAFHARTGLTADERDWVRGWLRTAVPLVTDHAVDDLAAQLESGLAQAPRRLLDSIGDRRRRAELGIE